MLIYDHWFYTFFIRQLHSQKKKNFGGIEKIEKIYSNESLS